MTIYWLAVCGAASGIAYWIFKDAYIDFPGLLSFDGPILILILANPKALRYIAAKNWRVLEYWLVNRCRVSGVSKK